MKPLFIQFLPDLLATGASENVQKYCKKSRQFFVDANDWTAEDQALYESLGGI